MQSSKDKLAPCKATKRREARATRHAKSLCRALQKRKTQSTRKD